MGLLVETTAWTVACCAVWLATLTSITVAELCFAVAASIPCGILARAGRRALGASWRFRPRWVLWAVPVATTLVVETVVLFRTALFHPRPGRMTTIDLPAEEPRLAAGRAAAATLALCSTPGSIVADSDRRQHRLTVHRLLSAGPDLESVVGR